MKRKTISYHDKQERQFVILPDSNKVYIKDKRFFSHAVSLYDKSKCEWLLWSSHSTYEAAHKKMTQCKNQYSLTGVKEIDWMSAIILQVQSEVIK